MKYISKKRELCLVIKPLDRIIDEQRRVKVIPGKRVEFFNGLYETNDPEIIDFMSKHPYKGRKFFEVHDRSEKAQETFETLEKFHDPRMDRPAISKGAVSTENVIGQKVQEIISAEPPTRPSDTIAISPELVRVIDERIQASLGTIIELLRPVEKKAEKAENMMTGKPTKVFTCPYCHEPFPSGFAVGKHKPICEKRPK